jgi:hypothetical protein
MPRETKSTVVCFRPSKPAELLLSLAAGQTKLSRTELINQCLTRGLQHHGAKSKKWAELSQRMNAVNASPA